VLFASPDDVTSLQKDVAAQVKALTASIGDCIKAGTIRPSDGAPTDPGIFREWKAMAKRVTLFLNEEPNWVDANTQYDRGLAIQKDLQPWYDRINAAGCKAPTKPAPPAAGPKGEAWGEGWAELVGLALLAFALHEAKGL
jgi:hypothetical protein